MPPVLIKLLLAVSLVRGGDAERNARAAGTLFLAAIVALIVARFASDYGYLPVNSGLVLTLGGLIGLLAAAGTLRFTVQSNTVNSETSMPP